MTQDDASLAKPPGTLTPPASDSDSDIPDDQPPARTPDPTTLLSKALHVLATEAAALSHISTLYQTDPEAQSSLRHAVSAVLDAHRKGGKLLACGVGKSGYIAQKLVATCKSLGLGASFLHACEALHGDLGDIRPHDVVLFVTFSGQTAELLNLLPHIPLSTRILALSGHSRREKCAVLSGRGDSVLLPATIPEKEEVSFGVAAPTVSTTVALAVADMLALTVAEALCGGGLREVFGRNHPGGAIGVGYREVEGKREVEVLKSGGGACVVLELPSPSISGSDGG
ncbi:SIS domain-containing protein [Teratosphaeria nubilosa]|uniref:SIS domain-containing protein n=1 Tax=Teratosphaeria nubilosa TaxID=161662 RepID=A0A6G1LIY0_9PEZI|nr:SIS domain-containing protein [Teratosphaeria nubilosa]